MQFQPHLTQFGHRQQLDAITEFAGVANVGNVERINSPTRNFPPTDAGPKRQMSKDGQFLRGIGAVHIHRGIRFRVTQALGFLHRFQIAEAGRFHLRENEVARSVQDGVNRLNLVGDQAGADIGNDRNAAGHTGLERYGTAQFAGTVEQLRTMLGDQRFVGGDNIFTRLK